MTNPSEFAESFFVTTTVHDWVESFALGESKPMPTNCIAKELIEYGYSRFNYRLVRNGNFLKRICPTCGR